MSFCGVVLWRGRLRATSREPCIRSRHEPPFFLVVEQVSGNRQESRGLAGLWLLPPQTHSGFYWMDQPLMPRSQISGASTIFRGKPKAGSWRPAKCHRTAIPNICARSHKTAGTVLPNLKYKETLSQDVCKAAVRWKQDNCWMVQALQGNRKMILTPCIHCKSAAHTS